MRRIATRSLLGAVGLCLALAAAVAGWGLWERARDPLALVRQAPPALSILRARDYAMDGAGGRRLYRDLTLAAEGGARFDVTISLPRDGPRQALPVLLIIGGLAAGKDSLRHLPDIGANAAVTYDFPLRPHEVDAGWWGGRLLAARRAALAMPGQVVALASWLRQRPWDDGRRISLLGYSLGALAVPAVHHMGSRHGVAFGPSVMAFGGAGLEGLVERNLRIRPRWLRPVLAWLAASAGRQVEPAVHLPHLRGEFLIVNAAADRRIPPAAARALAALTPEPKTVVTLPSGHIDPRDPALMNEIVAITRRWLLARGAVNRPN